MYRRDNCWYNALQELFWGHMKDEINYKVSLHRKSSTLNFYF